MLAYRTFKKTISALAMVVVFALAGGTTMKVACFVSEKNVKPLIEEVDFFPSFADAWQYYLNLFDQIKTGYRLTIRLQTQQKIELELRKGSSRELIGKGFIKVVE